MLLRLYVSVVGQFDGWYILTFSFVTVHQHGSSNQHKAWFIRPSCYCKCRWIAAPTIAKQSGILEYPPEGPEKDLKSPSYQ